MLLVSIIFFLVIGYLSFSYENGYKIIEKNKIVDVSQKSDSELTNKEIIEKLENTATNSNVDLIYQTQNILDNKTNIQYYMTNNLGTLDKYTNSSPECTEDCLNYPSIFNQTQIYPLTNVQKFSIQNIQLAVVGEEQDITNFIENTNDENMTTSINEDPIVKHRLINSKIVQLELLVIVMLEIVFIFFQMGNLKKNAIRKLDGYTFERTLKIEIIHFNKLLLKINIVVFSLITLFMLFKFNIYIEFSPKFLMLFVKLIIVINVLFFLSFNFVYLQASIKDLKNDIKGKKIIFLLNFFKIFFLIVMAISTVKLTKEIHNLNGKKNEYEEKKTLTEYSYVPIYSSNVTTAHEGFGSGEEEENIDDRLGQFYNDTVTELEGVLGSFDGGATAEGIKEGIVNDNYLEMFSIKDENHKRIKPTDISTDEVTLLIPVQYKNSDWIDEFISQEQETFCDKEVNKDCLVNIDVIFTEENSKYTNIDWMSRQGTQFLVDPLVEVITEGNKHIYEEHNYLGKMVSSPIAGESYIIKTDLENPNEVSKPYINDAKLGNVIRETPLLSNHILDQIITVKNSLIIDSFQMYITVAVLCIISYYLIQIYLNNNKKKLSIMQTHGFSKIKILRNQLIIILSSYIIATISLFILSQIDTFIILRGTIRIETINGLNIFSLCVLLLFLILEIILLMVSFNVQITKSLKKNIKGDK